MYRCHLPVRSEAHLNVAKLEPHLLRRTAGGRERCGDRAQGHLHTWKLTCQLLARTYDTPTPLISPFMVACRAHKRDVGQQRQEQKQR
jgi:hypothetical protein